MYVKYDEAINKLSHGITNYTVKPISKWHVYADFWTCYTLLQWWKQAEKLCIVDHKPAELFELT